MRRAMTRLAGASAVAVCVATRLSLISAREPQADKFVPGCPIPYAAIASHHEVDASCAVDGMGGDKDLAQNKRKNNLCASGTSVTITAKSFHALQTQVDHLTGFQWGSPSKLPSEAQRAKLVDLYSTDQTEKIGEGSLVRFVGYLMHGDHSNTGEGNGEQVNCKKTTPEDNDIHLYLSWTRNEARDCNSMTAEVIPHFRPESWVLLSTLHTTPATHAWTKIVNADLDRPLRFTGHLMFDATHETCSPGEADKDARAPTILRLGDPPGVRHRRVYRRQNASGMPRRGRRLEGA